MVIFQQGDIFFKFNNKEKLKTFHVTDVFLDSALMTRGTLKE